MDKRTLKLLRMMFLGLVLLMGSAILLRLALTELSGTSASLVSALVPAIPGIAMTVVSRRMIKGRGAGQDISLAGVKYRGVSIRR